MEEKYILTDEKIEHYGRTLYRIKAIRDFSDVKNGDLGGFIEKEENLSHFGDCWVYDNAKIFNNAGIYNNAKVFDNVKVFGHAKVYDNAGVSGNVEIFNNMKIYDNAKVFGDAKVFDDVIIWKNAFISEASDYFCFVSVGSRNDTLYAYRTKESFVIQVGCFSGTIDEFIKKVKETHGDNKNKFAKEYLLIAEIIKNRFENK